MSGLVSGITGAAPIWHQITTQLLKDKVPHPPQRPPEIVQKRICSVSGLLPPGTESPTCQTRFEYFIKGTEPKKIDPGIQKVFIDKTTNDLAKARQTDNVEQRDEWVVSDPTGENYCITCPHPEPEKP